MVFRILYLTLQLLTLILLRGIAEGCETGWFGEKCMFKCQCLNLLNCSSKGECPRGQCRYGYFGPGCQYVDMAKTFSTPLTSHYLIDYSDSTCNTETNDEVNVDLTQGLNIGWFRLHFKKSSKEWRQNNCNCLGLATYEHETQNFTLKVNGNDKCSEGKFFSTKWIVDVMCFTLTKKINAISITGPAANDICSLYISGGRNSAYKQEASQSSEYTTSTCAHASRAVDSYTNGDYTNCRCSHTDNTDTPHWNLRFNRPQILTRVLVYNRDHYKDRLNNFLLETFTKNYTKVSYTRSENTIKDIYTIFLFPKTPVVQLRITVSSHLDRDNSYLTLCEVETYGETVCPDMTYGLWCNETCTCQEDEACDPVTGVCAVVCAQGMYGHSCENQCSLDCEKHRCNHLSGNCAPCKPGYTGDQCQIECLDGTYGIGCQKCSKNCADICEKNTGNCECKEGHTGILCDECFNGKYGDNCSLLCPESCKDKKCGRDSGECEFCQGDRRGRFCAECDDGFYGDMCYSECSERCHNGTCDMGTGNCFNCTDGYTGEDCLHAPNRKRTTLELLVWLLLVPTMSITCLCIICCCMRKEGSESAASESIENEMHESNTTIVTQSVVYTQAALYSTEV